MAGLMPTAAPGADLSGRRVHVTSHVPSCRRCCVRPVSSDRQSASMDRLLPGVLPGGSSGESGAGVSVLRAAVSRRQLPDDDRRAHRARHCPECHGWHRGARHVHCPIPRVRWVAGRCRQWPAYLRRLTPAVSGNELTTCMPNPPRLPVAVADLASSGRGRGSNGVSGPIMPGLMAWRQSHRADSAVVTIGTAAPVGSDLSALVRSGIPFQHVCPDPAAPGNLDTLFPGPGAHGSPVHRK